MGKNWDTRLESLAFAVDISSVKVSYYLQKIAKEATEETVFEILHGSLLISLVLHFDAHAWEETSKLKGSGQC